jgi:uncharacterized phage infection (PIP) family protein YhgE
MNRKPIRNETYDFSEGDVEVCESVEQLRDWHTKVKTDIQAMEGKIDDANSKQTDGKDIDEKWLKGIRYAKSLQESLKEMIENRIRTLKNMADECYFLDIRFREVAYQELPPDVYNELIEKASIDE